jgi:hypothetical protein
MHQAFNVRPLRHHKPHCSPERSFTKHRVNLTHRASELGVSHPTLHDLGTKYALAHRLLHTLCAWSSIDTQPQPDASATRIAG